MFDPNVPFFDLLVFGDKLGRVSLFGFQNGAFNSCGTYRSYGPFNFGTLTVSGGSIKTPEPGTLGFLACGLALFAGLASPRRVNALVAARG
jgi:hypothetical protein